MFGGIELLLAEIDDLVGQLDDAASETGSVLARLALLTANLPRLRTAQPRFAVAEAEIDRVWATVIRIPSGAGYLMGVAPSIGNLNYSTSIHIKITIDGTVRLDTSTSGACALATTFALSAGYGLARASLPCQHRFNTSLLVQMYSSNSSNLVHGCVVSYLLD